MFICPSPACLTSAAFVASATLHNDAGRIWSTDRMYLRDACAATRKNHATTRGFVSLPLTQTARDWILMNSYAEQPKAEHFRSSSFCAYDDVQQRQQWHPEQLRRKISSHASRRSQSTYCPLWDAVDLWFVVACKILFQCGHYTLELNSTFLASVGRRLQGSNIT